MKENSKKPHRKLVVTFPNLKRILDLLTAKAILTPRDNFFYCHPNQNVSDAKRLLRDKKFSGAPLKEKVLRRLVKLEKLEQCDGHIKHCSEVATEITGQDMIPEDTSIERLIGIFAGRKDNSPLFVAKNKSITGLITSADLDKIAVKVYFFILISALESLLLDIIGKGYEKYKSCLQNPGKVEKRRRRCKGELVGLDEYHYLMTPEILEIVWGSAIKKI
jgi:CBS domain-containing protein